jgi:hypothetical protein
LKAQIFFLKDQRNVSRQIESLLRSHLFQDIEVEHRIYDNQDAAGTRKIGKSYLELMRASTVKVGDFTVEAAYEDGSWGYYWDQEEEYLLRLPRELMSMVFPAVAVMNRMVIVPREIHKAFDAPTDFAYMFKPLDAYGVVLADFDGRDAIRRAVLRVAAQIRAEVVGLCRRHMSLQGTRSPDLEELARLLDVDQEFLEDLKQEVIRPFPYLDAHVTSGPLRLRKSSRVRLTVRYESPSAPGMVRVQIRPPAAKPLVHYIDFSSEKTADQVIEFDVVPKTAPYFPLEVLFFLEDAADDTVPPIALILDVTAE